MMTRHTISLPFDLHRKVHIARGKLQVNAIHNVTFSEVVQKILVGFFDLPEKERMELLEKGE